MPIREAAGGHGSTSPWKKSGGALAVALKPVEGRGGRNIALQSPLVKSGSLPVAPAAVLDQLVFHAAAAAHLAAGDAAVEAHEGVLDV